MLARTIRTLLLIISTVGALNADTIQLVNTIPSGNLFLQPPLLTGGGLAFGGTGTGVALAYGFISPASAALGQVSVVVEYENFAPAVTGRSPMLLTLFTDSNNLPGTPIETWSVPLDPADISLTVVTVNSITNSLLQTGHRYWLAEAPSDASGTAIGWGLASAGYPGIQLPQASEAAGSSVWTGGSSNLATEFSVSGTTVPEPATFEASLLVTLAILVAGRRAVPAV